MRTALILLLLTVAAHAADIRRGADVSAALRVEAAGGEFTVLGKPVDLFALMRARGLDTVRLRVWHTPADGRHGLADALVLARRARDAGLDVMPALHYSDTWADPGHQAKPAAWADLPFAALADSVQAWTRDVLAALAAQGTPPALVQLGNEIGGGLLWPDGRVGGRWDTPDQRRRLATLLRAGARAVKESRPDAPPAVVLHVAEGGDPGACLRFFAAMEAGDVPWDVAAVSFYPWWHGTFADLEATLAALAERFGKPVLVAETAYPWTLSWSDETHNLVGLREHGLPGYPPTSDGQRRYLTDLLALVARTPGDLGAGVLWWAPEWLPAAADGSPWENCALFDFQGEALPAWEAWAAP